MKTCSKCKLEKPLKDFAPNRSKTSGSQTFCKKCQKAYQKDWYAKNKERHKHKVAQRNKFLKTELLKRISSIALSCGCAKCGYNKHPAPLEFHHLENKVKNISDMVTNFCKWEAIEAEIQKCIVLCANCHRVETAKEHGWYADTIWYFK